MDNKPKYNKDSLGKLYKDSIAIDKKVFAEQKSNVMLYSGDHYAKPGSKFWNNVRDNRYIDNATKIRVVKNHTQKICKTYVNEILNAAPGVHVQPRQEKELAHQKTAQLNQAAWEHIQQKTEYDKRVSGYAHDFIIQGEVVSKVYWNPKKGRHIGFKQALTKEGEPIWDQEPDPLTGEPGVPKKGPAVFSGFLDFERIFSFNLLRDPKAKSMDDSEILGEQKLLSLSEAKDLVGNDPEKIKLLQTGLAGADYVVFDANDQRYVETKDQCLLVEWFVKPGADYPEGHYFLCTPEGDILNEMDLPFGVFPINYEGFDELSSTPRHYSIIKVIRPYQSHLNFLASKHVEHAVTLGDDKIVTQMGGKIQQGGLLPGIRHVQATGDIQVIQGRMGEQFVNQMVPTITEMYQVANVAEVMEDKVSQLDAFTLLYRSMRDKKRFSTYAEKFERFLRKNAEIALELFKNYVDEQELIPAIGRAEQINIAEFKISDKLHTRIDLVPQTEDMESKLGKQLQINQLLQYAGSNLTKQDLGKLMRTAPFSNKEAMFDDWTMDYDNGTNDILALDRGDYPQPRQNDDHPYQIKRLEHRMSLADFQFLHPFIQQQYQRKKAEHIQIEAQQAAELQRAESGFIPADGPLTPCDMYVSDPKSPGKTQRVRLPYSALVWLTKKLEEQGSMQAALSQLSQASQAELASMLPQAMPQGSQGQEHNQMPTQQPYLSQPGGAQI